MTLSSIDPELLARGGLSCTVTGVVATITLAQPEHRNAQTPLTWRALRLIGSRLDPAVRVVLVRAEGETFSSGVDRRLLSAQGVDGEMGLFALQQVSDAEMAETIAGFQEGFSWLGRPGLVSIAVVQGAAVGAGFQLALACDLRVLADDARFAMREAMLGLVPDLGGTKQLVDLVGYSRAVEICATTRWVEAEEALRIGLANTVVPREELDTAVAELVAAVTAPIYGAVTDTKSLLLSARRLTADDQRRAERDRQVQRLRELAALMG